MDNINRSLISGNKLKQAVNILFDMEMHLYMMSIAYNSLTEEINSLGFKRKLSKPQKQKPNLEKEKTFFYGSVFYTAIAGIVAGIIYCICDFLSLKELSLLIILFSPLALILYVAAGAILGALSGALVGSITWIISFLKKRSLLKKQFKKDLEEYAKKLKLDEERVKAEFDQKSALELQRLGIAIRYHESKEVLEEFYNQVGIDEKFQSIGAIGIMQEFIRLGISSKLYGVDGLYYLILQEYKYINIIGKLDHICKKLDEISNGISQMHDSIDEMNRKSAQLVKETVRMSKIADQASKNSAVTAYNTERINKELEYRDIIHLLLL